MTWAKYGNEFFDQLVGVGFPEDIDDACQLTHTQAIHYVYSVESMELRFRKNQLQRFATSTQASIAAAALVACGLWAEHGDEYEIVHHADVIRQSLAAQASKKESDKKAAKKYRQRKSSSSPVSADVSADVGDDVSAGVTLTQSVSHTSNNQAADSTGEIDNGDGTYSLTGDPWAQRYTREAA